MPVFKFYAGSSLSGSEANVINHAAGSGLGLFSSSTGSVGLAAYQDVTSVTDASGNNIARPCNNIKYISASSGKLSSDGVTYNLTGIPNNLATFQVRFAQDSGGSNIKTQNAKIYPYDRVSPTSWPSSVIVQLVELQHTGVNTTGAPTYSGTSGVSWKKFYYDTDAVAGGYVYGTPSSSGLVLYPSPGPSGSHASGTNSTGLYHDWFIGLSASPNTIGSKNFGLWMELEYTTVP